MTMRTMLMASALVLATMAFTPTASAGPCVTTNTACLNEGECAVSNPDVLCDADPGDPSVFCLVRDFVC